MLHPCLLLPHIVVADPGLARRRPHAGGQNSHGGRLACAVRPEQSENLSRRDLERKSIERRNLRLRLLRAFCIGTRNETSASAQRRGGVIDLAQILSANTDGHAEQSSIGNRVSAVYRRCHL